MTPVVNGHYWEIIFFNIFIQFLSPPPAHPFLFSFWDHKSHLGCNVRKQKCKHWFGVEVGGGKPVESQLQASQAMLQQLPKNDYYLKWKELDWHYFSSNSEESKITLIGDFFFPPVLSSKTVSLQLEWHIAWKWWFPLPCWKKADLL